MAEIQKLSPGPSPKVLTARSSIRTLLEHQLAFWAQNNKAGSLTEQMSSEQVQTLWGALQAMAQKPKVHFDEFNGLSRPLKNRPDKGDTSETDPPHYAITKNMLARMLGYKNYQSLRYYLTSDRYIINRRNVLVPLQESFSNANGTLVSMPSKEAIALLKRKEALRIRKTVFDESFPSEVVTPTQTPNLGLDKDQTHSGERRVKRHESRSAFNQFVPTDYVTDASVPTSIAPNPKPAPPALTWEELRAQYLADQ